MSKKHAKHDVLEKGLDPTVPHNIIGPDGKLVAVRDAESRVYHIDVSNVGPQNVSDYIETVKEIIRKENASEVESAVSGEIEKVNEETLTVKETKKPGRKSKAA